jgi:hypothetical protein
MMMTTRSARPEPSCRWHAIIAGVVSLRAFYVCCSSMFLSVVRSRFACKLRATGRKEGHRIAAGRAEFCVADDEGA